MNHYSLFCINFDNLETVGISVLNSSGVQIINGTIDTIGYRGVECIYCSNSFLHNIVINGITTKNSMENVIPTGIYLEMCEYMDIYNCIVKNVNINVRTFSGFFSFGVFGLGITKCKVENVKNQDGACAGFQMFLCMEVVLKQCSSLDLQTFYKGVTNTIGHTCIGFLPFFCFDLKFKCCEAKNIIGTCDDAHGFSMFVCLGPIILNNCIVDNVQDGVGENTGAKSTGIEIYSSNVVVYNCHVSNISAINPQDKQCSGFSVSGALGVPAEFVRFKDCSVKNVNVVDENGNQSSYLDMEQVLDGLLIHEQNFKVHVILLLLKIVK